MRQFQDGPQKGRLAVSKLSCGLDHTNLPAVLRRQFRLRVQPSRRPPGAGGQKWQNDVGYWDSYMPEQNVLEL